MEKVAPLQKKKEKKERQRGVCGKIPLNCYENNIKNMFSPKN